MLMTQRGARCSSVAVADSSDRGRRAPGRRAPREKETGRNLRPRSTRPGEEG